MPIGEIDKVWLNNIKNWTSLTVPQLLTAAQDRRTWLHSCCKVCLVPPTTSVGHGTSINHMRTFVPTTVKLWNGLPRETAKIDQGQTKKDVKLILSSAQNLTEFCPGSPIDNAE
ncbi:hypothetical protein Bbelb_289850 [Branchiostoma belcheri]|nr:hypothetical protein Bbelb_289850 [Branchiostoma belcheri]